MYLLIPARHHLLTKYQKEYIDSIFQNKAKLLTGDSFDSKEITAIIWAITSSNHQSTRRNPLPGHRREALLENHLSLFKAPSYIYHIDDLGYSAKFADYLIKKIAVDSLSRFELTSKNTIVLTSTVPLIEQFTNLNFPILPQELTSLEPEITHTKRAWEIIEEISNGNEDLESQITKESLNFYTRYLFFEQIKELFDDPLLGSDGDLTDTRDYNVYVRAFDEGAIRKYNEIRKYVKSGRIVDIGCATGSIIKKMSEDSKLVESDLYGIEISRKLFSLCEQRKENGDFSNDNVFFYHRNIVAKPLFKQNSIATFTTFSLTHELESYSGRESLLSFLKNTYHQLQKGGRYINLDVVGPENKNDHVLAYLDHTDGENPEETIDTSTIEQNPLREYLNTLSTKALFYQFARDFRKEEGYKMEYTEETHNKVKYIRLTYKDICEFMSKKDYHDNWVSEMHETFAFWSYTDWTTTLREVGFKIHSDSHAFQNPWIIENRLKDKVFLYTPDLKAIDYPPTNVKLIAIKP